ncbi:MAG: DUF1501 domain-containing protein [Planctomycetaceae bacterium]|nr:DUF1501 domain-containing protein [Planctomycetaceae bacterium]
MFTVYGRSQDRLSRRSFVQAGLLGVGGLSLSDYLTLRTANAAPQSHSRGNGKSVILFWMSGGPGHMETWDPKPNAVDQYRGPFGAISTSVAGTQFGELLPEQAKIADKVSIVRTVCHKSGDHTKGNHWMLTGYEGPAFNAPDNRVQKRPAMGSVISKLCGSNERGMPAYTAVPHLRGGTDNIFHYATYLGGGHDPFIVNSDPNKSDFRVQNLSLQRGLTLDRLDNRRHLLSTIDHHRAAAEEAAQNMNSHQQNAFELLTSEKVRDAFDISREDDSLRDQYGRHTFGQSALLARRLVESGVSFVTVNCEPWDHHGTANRYKTEEGANKLIPPFDRALAALVRDLEDRGLSDQTLIVAMGEFGRTPRMNSAGGRDHWGHTFSVLFSGGGLRMGQTIGSSTPRGEYVADLPFDPQDVTATVYHHMGLNPHQTLQDRAGRPIHLAERGTPIAQLIG